MHLLIDNSNTLTKFALDFGGELSEWRGVIPTSDLSKTSIQTMLHGQTFEKVTLCSVVPDASVLMKAIFDQPIHHISHQSKMPITIDYPIPSKIGADRLANASAAILDRQGSAIVIDFGTAVTFDVISKAGSYLGGVIAPGTASLRDYLHQKTALLPAIQLEEPNSAIGRSTEEAMQVGAVIGYRGLIREILNEVRRELGGTPKIFATGGDAELIGKGINDIDIIDQDLTMKGIQVIGTSNH
ncbi:type III pantothenate kinase [Akkermansiaceae bacterium]|nr:type III pantothenate kinase [Verrucomicrobiota bacterium]MDA7516696.1 type III pantothenate kinase [Akkermansiaceae bacterium]MBT6168975.1 type III pantothenate kinase [Verrucomicrobiota bacterium]MDA7658558.1 type III pantothenate kinase [Akkermansiaceae bacterium]MDB4610696.1 type III pantothenate kinase [Akkermansiaceae bacterium]